MGIAAYISGDKKLIEVFNGDGDAYIDMAKVVYNETIDKSDPRRKKMKAIALGINYGLSAYGLAEREDMTEDEAEEVISAVLTKFKTLKRWIERQSKEKKCTYTVIGRKGWLNPYSEQCDRNALNNPIQGTAGDMLKKAMGRMNEAWFFPYPFGLVAAVHDELVADVPEAIAEDVAKFMERHMVEVANEMCVGMKFKAEALIGDSWSVKQ
jgi:DNA polymerase-1